MNRRTGLTRALVALVWVSLIAGPTPGAVGSCSGDEDLEADADLRAYCKEREELVCVRGEMRNEYGIDAQDDCRRDALDRCATRFWYDSCKPSRRETEACLTALRLVDTLHTQVTEIDECNSEALACVETSDVDPADYGADAGVGP